jgi:hypothetical protein
MAPGVPAGAHTARRGQDRGGNWENVSSYFPTIFAQHSSHPSGTRRCVRTVKKTFFLTSVVSDSILTGFDVDGRPIIYMRPGRENTETSPRQLRHLVYILCVRSRFVDKLPNKLIIWRGL